MYNDPQGSYPPQHPQWNGAANGNDYTQQVYLPPTQNFAAPRTENGPAPIQQGSYASPNQGFAVPTQSFPPPTQWSPGAPPVPQGFPPAQNQPPAQPSFVYAPPVARRSGLMPSRGAQKSNLSMMLIGGATALVLIVGLAFFVILSNQGQKQASPVVQADVATPTATSDMTTPTPEATPTQTPTPMLALTPTPMSDTTTTTSAPPAAQQPAPTAVLTPTPTAKPTPTASPASFTYDYNPVNGTLLTNPPATFCDPGHEAQKAGVQCVADFKTNAGGYVVTCKDNKYVSHNGGNKGACATYGGEGKKWYQHTVKK